MNTEWKLLKHFSPGDRVVSEDGETLGVVLDQETLTKDIAYHATCVFLEESSSPEHRSGHMVRYHYEIQVTKWTKLKNNPHINTSGILNNIMEELLRIKLSKERVTKFGELVKKMDKNILINSEEDEKRAVYITKTISEV